MFFVFFAGCDYEARNTVPVAKFLSPHSVMKDFLLSLPSFFSWLSFLMPVNNTLSAPSKAYAN